MIIKDRRKAKQDEIRNEHGELQETIIRSYTKKDYFLTGDEFKFLRVLENIYKNNSDIKVFVQVALNSIVDINNLRAIKELNSFNFYERSIDFVIYNCNRNSYGILYCIELNGEEHYTDDKIIERDRRINNIFNIAGIKLLTIRQKEIEKDNNGCFEIESVKKFLQL